MMDQIQNSSDLALIDLVPLDDVKTTLYRIEQRDRFEQDRVFTLMGPRPEVEEVEEPPEEEPVSIQEKSAAKSKDKEGAKSSQKEPKKKTKKAIKKDLPESVKNKLANSAAMIAVGGAVKSWMMPGGLAPPSSAPKKKPVSKLIPKTIPGTKKTIQTIQTSKSQKSAKKITLQDAIFTMEQDRQLRSSNLLYKWCANIK